VVALYGMGSFFRGELHDDVDLVVVLSCEIDGFLKEARAIRAELSAAGESVGERLDVTVFTASEFVSGPLRDMATLILLYWRESRDGTG
jgi:hypothetical protein